MADAGYGGPGSKVGKGQFVADKKPKPKSPEDKKQGPYGKGNNEVPDFFEARLDEMGLKITPDGRIIRQGTGAAATRPPSVAELRLIQQGFNRFGLTNDWFDPNRVAFSGEMAQTNVGKAPVYYDLFNGTATSGGGVADDETLAALRERVGFSPETSYAYLQENNLLENYGIAGSTFEGFMGYQQRARQNYLDMANAKKPLGGSDYNPGPSFIGGFDVMSPEELAGLGGAVSDFMQNRQQQLIAQQSYSPTFDLDEFTEE